jgi:AcrR family transcriptional regulator
VQVSARRARPAPQVTLTPRGAERRSRRQAQPASGLAASGSGASAEVGAGRWQVSDIQRSRLLAGAVAAVSELGYEQTTVGRITARARVSRRTFYEIFAGREECLAALLDDVVGQVQRELQTAGLERLSWRERIRTGLWTILSFLDREPLLAEVCVVEASRASGIVQARRATVLEGLVAAVEEGRPQSSRGEGCGALTAEGMVGAALAIVQARLLRTPREPLGDLLGELMGMIVLPYLGPAAARRERERPAPALPVAASQSSASRPRGIADPLNGLGIRVTYRTARVLAGVAELGKAGNAPSNRQVADYAGIHDPGQVSKLLRRLEHLGLLANDGESRASGEPNAWKLTAKGEQVTRSIVLHTTNGEQAA